METKHIIKLAGALLTGVVIGTSLGMLFAPQKGSKMRGKIWCGANKMAKNARKKIKREVEELRRKAEELEAMAMEGSEE